MQIGVIGLGRMGGNITRRLMQNGHEAVVYDHDAKAVAALDRDGAIGAPGLDTLVRQLRAPRAIWVMLPAGKITDDTVFELAKLSLRRMTLLSTAAIHFVAKPRSSGSVLEHAPSWPMQLSKMQPDHN